jgi:hypothetical protein
MKVHVLKPFGKLGSSQLTHVYDVAYDAEASSRAAKLIQTLQRDNLGPRTIVAGLRAYLSLSAEMEHLSDIHDKNGITFSVSASGGSDESRFHFHDFPVELDMSTPDDDDIRVTCGWSGIAERLESRPDVQVSPTLALLFYCLQGKIKAGRRDFISRYDDKIALQLGFKDGPEIHVVHIGALVDHYASHHQPMTLELYHRDFSRILDSR